MKIRIGTRGSQLALWQANEVARLLPCESEIVTIKTTGDKRTDVSLASIGGKGLFIKELEEALERGEIDVAVHSLKDVPSIIPEQFELAAFLERADPRDAWVHPSGIAIEEMPAGAVIGTSAPRRRAQLAALHPRLHIEDIRGNVDTRIAKARSGQYAGIVLAGAGLQRLGRAREITSYFSIEEMLPAAGQGIVAIECLRGNDAVCDAVRDANHAPSESAALCERGVLQKFGKRLDCYSEVAVHCTIAVARSLGCSVAPEEPPAEQPRDRVTEQPEITIRAFFHGARSTQRGRNAEEVIDAVYEELQCQASSIS
jgi:hydroxymethylbilane synthase